MEKETVEQRKAEVKYCLICTNTMHKGEDGLWHCDSPECWYIDAD